MHSTNSFPVVDDFILLDAVREPYLDDLLNQTEVET